jgi:hypothetical protein
MDVRVFWYQGVLDGWLILEGSAENHEFDFVVQNASSSNACSYVVSAALPRMPATERASYAEGGSCDVMVTVTAPNVGDVFEGTFSAVVGTYAGTPLVTLTDGRFRAPRLPDGLP